MCDFDVAKRVHIIKKFLEKKREKKRKKSGRMCVY